jgi:hypothetical protein
MADPQDNTLEPKPPASVTTRYLELRDELKEISAKLKKLDDAARRQLPLPEMLKAGDIEDYRGHLQKCKDRCRAQMLLEITQREIFELKQMGNADDASLDLERKRKTYLEGEQQRWMESQPDTWHKQTLDALCLQVEAWLDAGERAASAETEKEASVLKAKRSKAPKNQKRDQRIFEIIQTGAKGRKYSRTMHERGINGLPSWVNFPGYLKGYDSPKWRRLIIEEKNRVARRMKNKVSAGLRRD